MRRYPSYRHPHKRRTPSDKKTARQPENPMTPNPFPHLRLRIDEKGVRLLKRAARFNSWCETGPVWARSNFDVAFPGQRRRWRVGLP